jgi:hypothetical protein
MVTENQKGKYKLGEDLNCYKIPLKIYIIHTFLKSSGTYNSIFQVKFEQMLKQKKSLFKGTQNFKCLI